jgi:hypothetical protein
MSEGDASARDFSFLFRTDQGEISRRVWLQGMALIAVVLLVLSLGWSALAPFAYRAPTRGSVDPLTIFAYVYLLAYAFAVILGAICFYNLSAKRFRARGKPAALAGLAPFSLFVTGAAFWLQPRSEGFVSLAIPIALAALTAAVLLWTGIELGALAGDREKKP